MHIKRDSLLTIDTDAKTRKGTRYGVLTGILYLAPSDVSGYEVCPKASAGCKAACLYSAGRGKMHSVSSSRINRTRWFFEDRDSFMAILVKDIKKIVRKAKREKKMPAIRLNGTSDIAFEKIRVTVDGVSYRNLMLAFPDVQFYDYTKILNRKAALHLPNYHLTFSLAEDNDDDAEKALKQGYNVAVVMDLKPKDKKPATWNRIPVVDGDQSDIRFWDGSGNIVALTAKGDARKDTSGFVRDPH